MISFLFSSDRINGEVEGFIRSWIMLLVVRAASTEIKCYAVVNSENIYSFRTKGERLEPLYW